MKYRYSPDLIPDHQTAGALNLVQWTMQSGNYAVTHITDGSTGHKCAETPLGQHQGWFPTAVNEAVDVWCQCLHALG